MKWDPFGLFALARSENNNGDKNKVTSTEVVIGQLFENGPLVEVIDFVHIPLEEKKKKLMIEREKRLKRKVQVHNAFAKK